MTENDKYPEELTEEDIFGEDDIYEDAPEEIFYTDDDYKGEYDGCIPLFKEKK